MKFKVYKKKNHIGSKENLHILILVYVCRNILKYLKFFVQKYHNYLKKIEI